MKCFKIADWKKYEPLGVSPGDLLVPLNFMRWPCHGLELDLDLHKIREVTGPHGSAAVIGIFVMLVEQSARLPRRFRGWLLDESDPATVQKLASRLQIPQTQLQKAIDDLMVAGLLEREELPYAEDDEDEEEDAEDDEANPGFKG